MFYMLQNLTWGLWLYFPSKKSVMQMFIAVKKSIALAGFEPSNLESDCKHANNYTTEETR
jgi:hypothetical protein